MKKFQQKLYTAAFVLCTGAILAVPVAASASMDAGFDFRATSAYVTDPVGSYFVGATAYPTTSDGITYGWTSTTGLGTRNRSTSVDPRLAGIVYRVSGTSAYNDFRVDLPSPGAYDVSIALGDYSFTQTGNYAEIYDGTTLLATVNAAKASQPAGSFFDMQSNLYTAANFFTSEVPSTLTFSTTQLIVRIGTANSAGGNDTIAWLHVSSAVAAPTVTTSAASSITASEATLNGNITANGGADATQHGFAYSTNSSLSTGVSTTTQGAFTGTGAFTDDLSSLSSNTTYYYRAYATNSAGTSYGSIQSFTTLSGSGGTASWYNNSWGYRIKVTVDHTKVGSTLTNFPVYVDLSNLPASFFSHVKSDGGDIRVTEYDGTTEIPREVVAIDTSGDTGELYFKAPSLSSTEDTGFYIYYSNASASDYAVTDTYGRNAVWSNGYAAVWHMENTSVIDSSGNGNNAVSVVGTPTLENGKLGQGVSFDGTSDGINVGKPASLEFSGTDPFTVSAWANASDGTTYTRLFGADEGGGKNGYRLMSNTGSTWNFSLDDTAQRQLPGGTVVVGTPQLITGVFDGAEAYLYVNSQQVSSLAISSWAPDYSQVTAFGIGYRPTGSTNYFDGSIDEMRISSVARTSDWISTEYADENSPSTFLSVGTEETGDGGGESGGSTKPARKIRLFEGFRIKLLSGKLKLLQ